MVTAGLGGQSACRARFVCWLVLNVPAANPIWGPKGRLTLRVRRDPLWRVPAMSFLYVLVRISRVLVIIAIHGCV